VYPSAGGGGDRNSCIFWESNPRCPARNLVTKMTKIAKTIL